MKFYDDFNMADLIIPVVHYVYVNVHRHTYFVPDNIIANKLCDFSWLLLSL